MTRPSREYLSWISCRPLYCGVRPQRLATLTNTTTLPLSLDRSTSLPSRPFMVKLSGLDTFFSSARTRQGTTNSSDRTQNFFTTFLLVRERNSVFSIRIEDDRHAPLRGLRSTFSSPIGFLTGRGRDRTISP